MYAFLIVFSVTIFGGEGQETHKFNIRSGQTFDQAVCVARAKDLADYTAELTARVIPNSTVQVQIGCALRPAREI